MPISISILQSVTWLLVTMERVCALLRKPRSVGKLTPRAPRGDQGQRWSGGRTEGKGDPKDRQRLCSPTSQKGWQRWRLEPRAWLHSRLEGQVHASALWPDEMRCASLPLVLRTRLGPVSWGNRDQPLGLDCRGSVATRVRSVLHRLRTPC